MPTFSDAELMQAVRDGDLAAFEEIVLRHQAAAWKAAYRFTGDADDLVLLDHGRVAAAGRPADVLRREVLSPVYEIPVEVRTDEVTGRPYVLPRPPA